MKRLIFIAISLIVTIILCYFFYSKFQVKKVDEIIPERNKTLLKNNITLKVGETFKIELGENASIGFSNCWINSQKCSSVIDVKKWYLSSKEEKEGCEGCGGNVYWEFKAVMIGVDTIKIKSCPTGRKQKKCSSFQEDSIYYKEDIKYSPKYNRAIIVRVVH